VGNLQSRNDVVAAVENLESAGCEALSRALQAVCVAS